MLTQSQPSEQDRLSLQATNVGVLASYRVGNDPPVYLPVDVYEKEGQASVRSYTFYFITGQDLQALDCLYDGTDD